MALNGLRAVGAPSAPPYNGKRMTYKITTLGENDKGWAIEAEPGSLTKCARQGALYIEIERPSTKAMTGWGGNPDTALKIRATNRAANTTSRCGVRVLDCQARNRGTTTAWVKAFDLGCRNDSGSQTDSLIAQHIRAENYGTIDTENTILDLEMSDENVTGSQIRTGIIIRSTDASAQAAVENVLKISHTSTNGFTNLIHFNGATGDTIAAGSVKDSDNADIKADYRIKCKINTTTIYLAAYDTVV